MENTCFYKSPVGYLGITADDSIKRIFFAEHIPKDIFSLETTLMKEAHKQLEEYFRKERQDFDLPIEFDGTELQKKVWRELVLIPYGETITYKELAIRTLNPKAYRAVGNACGKNPIAIVVPCHRVVGTGGKLTGFAGGIENKKILLDLEKMK